MINEKSIQSVGEAQFSTVFRRPRYEDYCFSQIPSTIRALFSGRGKGLPEDTHSKGPFERVVLLFVDAFGWTFFEKYKNSLPFLKRVASEGICSKITSLFPSTTAAHVTCIHTGLCPNQSGIYEWFLYEPHLNEIIAPLPFNYPGERALSTLPLDPALLYPHKTLFETLAEEGIQSHSFQPLNIADSTYSRAVLAGSTVHGYRDPDQGLGELLDHLSSQTYAFFYYGDVDAIGHRKGVYSQSFAESIRKIFTSIETFVSHLPTKTALLVTADHGMVDVSPKETLYLNQLIPNISKYLQFGSRNKPLVPAGSCRDFFLHVREECLEELKEILTHILKGKAEIWMTQDLLEKKLFGLGTSTHHFLSRVGNLAILPYEKEAIWWYEKGRIQQNFYGAHGGLTPHEMEIPFLFLEF